MLPPNANLQRHTGVWPCRRRVNFTWQHTLTTSKLSSKAFQQPLFSSQEIPPKKSTTDKLLKFIYLPWNQTWFQFSLLVFQSFVYHCTASGLQFDWGHDYSKFDSMWRKGRHRHASQRLRHNCPRTKINNSYRGVDAMTMDSHCSG